MIKVLVLGCNHDQVPYLKELKDKFYVIGTDLNAEAPGKVLCDRFYNVGYDDLQGLINIGNKEHFDENDKIFTASAQFAQLGCAHFAAEFNIPYPSVESIEICLDKVRFYDFFEINNLPIPVTNYVKNESDMFGCLNRMGIDKSYYLKSDYSKNPNYVYNFVGRDVAKEDIFWGRDRFLREHYIIQEEFIGEHVRINIIQDDFIIFPMMLGAHLSCTKEYIVNSEILIKLREIVVKLGLSNWIVKFDLVVSDSAYVVLDIGLDPPFRLNLYYNALSLNFPKFYIQHYLRNVVNYPVLEYEYSGI